MVGAILYVLWDANRNGLISRISKTAPNKFTPDRGLVGAAGQLVLPVVTVVAAHFLGVFRVVLEPLLGPPGDPPARPPRRPRQLGP